MKSIIEIETDLLSLLDYSFTETRTHETIIRVKNVIQILPKEDRLKLCEHYKIENMIHLIPFIQTSIRFFNSHRVCIHDKELSELVVKYICEYDQIIQSLEDPFETLSEEANNLFSGNYVLT